jgi:predicted transposase YbfD/YdcC
MIQVKANSKNLLQNIIDIIDTEEPIDEAITIDKKRDRVENREIKVFSADNIVDKEWGCQRVIQVHNYGIRAKKEYSQYHYYICSVNNDSALFFGKGIRSHWLIENQEHWVKDVIQGEDNSLIENGKIASNLSIIRNTVMNIYRVNNFKSIKKGTEIFANRILECLMLMNYTSEIKI